jgi:hypothetical protein
VSAAPASAVDRLHDALDALTTDQRRDATSILLGYLWGAADETTRTQALDAMRKYVS